MRKTKTIPYDESGAAIIELVMVVPVILIITAGLLDLSLLIRSELALDSAATAAVRLCMDNPECLEDEHILREYLQQVDPLMEEAQISIALDSEHVDSYTHHFYLGADGQEVVRDNSHRVSLPVTISLSLTREYFTPLGRGISLAMSGDGTLKGQASQSGTVDITRGDTW